MGTRGRPFQAGNTFGKGRPRGSRNKTTRAAQAFLNEWAELLMKKACAMALKGETTIMRTLLERLLPVCREMPVNVGRLPTESLEDLTKSARRLVELTASGELTVPEGNGMADLIESLRKLFETEQLERRVLALESAR